MKNSLVIIPYILLNGLGTAFLAGGAIGAVYCFFDKSIPRDELSGNVFCCVVMALMGFGIIWGVVKLTKRSNFRRWQKMLIEKGAEEAIRVAALRL